MLISKIRSKSSREFVSIIDQVIISEFDELNDQMLESRDSISVITKTVLAHYHENKQTLLSESFVMDERTNTKGEDLERLLELYKTDLINHIKSRLERAICENHDIFKGVSRLPKCLMEEILH